MTPEEINRRIAEITGDDDRHEWDEIGSNFYGTAYVCLRCGDSDLDEEKPPERGCVRDFWGDERAAMWAAEKFGMFEVIDTESRFLERVWKNGEEVWTVGRVTYVFGEREAEVMAEGATIPAAICNALLALDAKAVK